MFSKILIANRGEIACRIIATARKMGINTVAVYSDADCNALHVTQADEAIHIGPAPSSQSYLRADLIIDAALRTGAQAIHPGYGFLSENSEFAKLCSENNLIFIGPPTPAIEAMGSKSAAKTIMEKAGVPLVPGYHGEDQTPALLKESANNMGYPVLLKAVAGGGGKGMRQVWSEEEFDTALADAKRESKASFGNDDMLVEKYLTQPRHVEFQIFCDNHGNGVYLFERDCSVQRRHQKIIEEAPAPNFSQELRESMGESAVKAAQAINYRGAGTVEFLLDIDGSYYFMEMNTRLQVEHPVTEMITGEDLVAWQLKVAANEPLPKRQQDLAIKGHAFEARIYAEDPSNDFLPTAGTLVTLSTPSDSTHIRIDTGVIEGDEVSPFYDPMIAKLVVWDETRELALARTAKALRNYQITGLTTNISFLYDLATHPAFTNAELDTGFIENHHDSLFKSSKDDIELALYQAGLFLVSSQLNKDKTTSDPWQKNTAWRMNQAAVYQYELNVGAEQHWVRVALEHEGFLLSSSVQNSAVNATASLTGRNLVSTINGHRQQVNISPQGDGFTIFHQHGCTGFTIQQPDLGDPVDASNGPNFVAPMNGTVIDVMVEQGVSVKKDQPLIIMEAMKMQHTMRAPSDGVVNALFCAAGELVDGGVTLLEFVANESE